VSAFAVVPYLLSGDGRVSWCFISLSALCKVSSEVWLSRQKEEAPPTSVRSPALAPRCEVFVDMVVPLSSKEVEAQLAKLTKEMVSAFRGLSLLAVGTQMTSCHDCPSPVGWSAERH
jgi:hypothetical protein